MLWWYQIFSTNGEQWGTTSGNYMHAVRPTQSIPKKFMVVSENILCIFIGGCGFENFFSTNEGEDFSACHPTFPALRLFQSTGCISFLVPEGAFRCLLHKSWCPLAEGSILQESAGWSQVSLTSNYCNFARTEACVFVETGTFARLIVFVRMEATFFNLKFDPEILLRSQWCGRASMAYSAHEGVLLHSNGSTFLQLSVLDILDDLGVHINRAHGSRDTHTLSSASSGSLPPPPLWTFFSFFRLTTSTSAMNVADKKWWSYIFKSPWMQGKQTAWVCRGRRARWSHLACLILKFNLFDYHVEIVKLFNWPTLESTLKPWARQVFRWNFWFSESQEWQGKITQMIKWL